MKKIAILFVVVLMLIGAAFAVMKFVGLGPFAVETGEEVEEEPVDPAEAPRFVTLESMVIPVFQDDRVAAAVTVDVKIRVVGDANEDRVTHLLPQLRSAFLSELHGYVPRLLRTTQSLDSGLLQDRLIYVAEKRIGPDLVDDILVQSVVEQGAR